VFNLSGSELIFLVLIALVVLGPDKLPEAMRKAGKAYADFKKMTTGFQSEMKSVLDEPMRELRETAELAKKSAMWDMNATPDDTPAATKPVSGNMADHEPSDAAKRRMERATPPDLTVSTAALPVVSPADPEPMIETAQDAQPEPTTETVEQALGEQVEMVETAEQAVAEQAAVEQAAVEQAVAEQAVAELAEMPPVIPTPAPVETDIDMTDSDFTTDAVVTADDTDGVPSA
jgi:sec-independent protein translocase protein TatB